MPSIDHARKLEIATTSVRRLVGLNSPQRVGMLLSKLHAADVVTVLSSLEPSDRIAAWRALRTVDMRLASKVLMEMSEEEAIALLAPLGPVQVAHVLCSLPVDDAARLVKMLPDELLSAMREDDETERTISPELTTHMVYSDETAGRIMTTSVFAVPESLTVGEATRALQERSEQFEMVFYLYVVDDAWTLVGVVTLRQLLLTPPSTPLGSIMKRDVVSVRTDADQEEVAQTIARYDFMALPVVDADGMLAGLITVDDAMDILREEATEDIYALAGVSPEERVTGNPLRVIRLRFPWLCVNLVTATLSVTVINQFEDTIKVVVALATIMPIVSGMGGNAATQALTVIVRAFALGELEGVARWKVVLKELAVGLGVGCGVGLIGATAAAVYFGNPWLGLVLGLAMLANMLVAAVAGTVVPMVMEAFGLDPATGSSVFVTACTDMTGFGIFLGLATLFLPKLV